MSSEPWQSDPYERWALFSDSEFPSMEQPSWEELGLRHIRLRFGKQYVDCPECGAQLNKAPSQGDSGECPVSRREYDNTRYSKFKGQFNRDRKTLLTLAGAERRALWEKMRADVDAFGCWKYETDALLNSLEQETP